MHCFPLFSVRANQGTPYLAHCWRWKFQVLLPCYKIHSLRGAQATTRLFPFLSRVSCKIIGPSKMGVLVYTPKISGLSASSCWPCPSPPLRPSPPIPFVPDILTVSALRLWILPTPLFRWPPSVQPKSRTWYTSGSAYSSWLHLIYHCLFLFRELLLPSPSLPIFLGTNTTKFCTLTCAGTKSCQS